MSSSHTPGPWQWRDRSPKYGFYRSLVGADETQILDIGSGHGALFVADANLIAAAPELLEALVALSVPLEEYDFDPFLQAQARAAIAKAKGQEA